VGEFIHDDFLLSGESAKRLYHEYAKDLPIIDYHCHLDPKLIAENHQFKDITEIWLDGDHYKWRAMRANGVDEKYITGSASAEDKFEKWAQTVPYTLRNPLYHWTHLELKRYFGIDQLLSGENAKTVYAETTLALQDPSMRAQALIHQSKVEVVCTTDSPLDDLQYHEACAENDLPFSVLPTFRPDAFFAIENSEEWRGLLQKLEAATNDSISTYQDLISALEGRMDYFHRRGCRLSDHGFEAIFEGDFSESNATIAFQKLRDGSTLNPVETGSFKTHLLFSLCVAYAKRGWTQQFHLGALRNTNSRKLRELGADTGYDSIGDFNQAQSMMKLFDRLEEADGLTQTILYNLNPADNELFATMAGNYNDGSIPGKIQYGSGWWYLDQKDGMERQMNALSNMGLISRFVGMLTDSRSFLSYPRHEYFRRTLCNLFGQDMDQGLLPGDFNWIGKVIRDISYYNARKYFNFEHVKKLQSHA
jgi:glucuronate isomerase